MGRVFIFRNGYAITALVLFLIEVCIALFINDQFIRPYVGDFLVIVLIYCVIRSCLNISMLTAAAATLLFAYFVEGLQAVNIVGWLGLEHSAFARTVIGTTFDPKDLVVYTIGAGTVLGVDILRKNYCL